MRLADYTRRHGGRASRFWFGPFRPTVRLAHPDTLKLILRTAEPKPTSNGGYSHVLPWLGIFAIFAVSRTDAQ